MLTKKLIIVGFICNLIFSLTAMDYGLRETLNQMNPKLKEIIDQIDITTDKSRAQQNALLRPYTTPVLVMNELVNANALALSYDKKNYTPALPKDVINKILMIFWNLKVNGDETKKDWFRLYNSLTTLGSGRRDYLNIKKNKNNHMILDSVILTKEERKVAIELAEAQVSELSTLIKPDISIDLFKKALKLPSWYKNNLKTTTTIHVVTQAPKDSCLKQIILGAANGSYKTQMSFGAIIGTGITENIMRTPLSPNSNSVIITFDIFSAVAWAMIVLVVFDILKNCLSPLSFQPKWQEKFLLNKKEQFIFEQQLKNLCEQTKKNQKSNFFDDSFDESLKLLKIDNNDINYLLLRNKE